MTDSYNGWENRETWAFWLWVTNDQGWYNAVREFVTDRRVSAGDIYDNYDLGELVVEYVKDTLEELLTEVDYSPEQQHPLFGMLFDIGSWWRIDYAEIGAAARELVNES